MLRDVGDGIHTEVDCSRVRTWAEETLPRIHSKLIDSLRQSNLLEKHLLSEIPIPDDKVFYTRREQTWSTVRMVVPEVRLPLMEVTFLGFTSDCGIKICFDRWLQRSCHESHFTIVLEPRREQKMVVIADKSVNSPFSNDRITLADVAETLRARFISSLSMSGVLASRQSETMAPENWNRPPSLRHSNLEP